MISFRQGDLVTITGQVQNVEGDFLMIAIEGALDAAVPAMVSKTGVSLVRASIHEGDEVEGGFRVHSAIPNTPLVLLQLIAGDPTDPKSFSTAVRSTLTLVQPSGTEDRKATAPAAETTAAPAPAPAVEPAAVTAPAAAPVTEPEAPVLEAPTAPASNDAGETDETSDDSASDTTATLTADMVRRPEAPAGESRSIADLGTVREERSPLKPAGDVLLLNDPIDDEKN